MAVDEALLLGCIAAGPVLRLYSWSAPCVSLGYRQKPPPWLDRARALGVPCVRRATGGGSVLHGTDLTYAVAAPRGCPGIPDDMRGSYEWIRERLLAALRQAGIHADPSRAERRAASAEVCFSASTGLEIEAAGIKLVGSAQRRTRQAFLQHGSIRRGDDATLERALFGVASEAPPLGAWDAGALRAALVQAFEAALGRVLEPSVLTAEELACARVRMQARSSDPLALPPLA